MFLVFTALYIVGLILTLAILPRNAHDVEIAVRSSATVPLDVLMKRWWLRSVDIAFDDVDQSCSGQAAVVESENCLALPTVWEHADSLSVCHIYALSGSFFTFLLEDSNKTRTERPHIWLTHTEEAYHRLWSQTNHGEKVYECDGNYSDATCYPAVDHVGSNFMVNVTTPGYYCVILVSNDDASVVAPYPLGITWIFNYTSYNFTAIKSLYQVVNRWKDFGGEETGTTVIVSDLFNFTQKNCAILRLHCTDFTEHMVSINHLVKRWDLAVLLTFLYLGLSFALGVCAVAIHFGCKVCKRRESSSSDDFIG
jgi:hypothetical protein